MWIIFRNFQNSVKISTQNLLCWSPKKGVSPNLVSCPLRPGILQQSSAQDCHCWARGLADHIWIPGWWFGTAVGSTPTSWRGRAMPNVERWVARCLPWILSWTWRLWTLARWSLLWPRWRLLTRSMSVICWGLCMRTALWPTLVWWMEALVWSPCLWWLWWSRFRYPCWKFAQILRFCLAPHTPGTTFCWSMLTVGLGDCPMVPCRLNDGVGGRCHLRKV